MKTPAAYHESTTGAAVAVINYNGARFLGELLGSLETQTVRPDEILFIDNCSTDESVDYIRSRHTGVKLLPQATNLGFAKAGNLAARSTGCRYLALLNADMRLDPGWLRALIGRAEQDTAIAAVASKLRLYSDPQKLNGVGGSMNYIGYTWDRGMFEPDAGQYDDAQEVLFASAGAALFRRRVFLESGGFDERFFMYHEDVDLCWRFWILGYRVITEPAAVAYHHFGGSTREARGLEWRELIGERNNLRALLKNYEGRNLVRAMARLLALRQPARRKAAQLKNFAWNLYHLPETAGERRRIQKRRQRSDADLQHLIVQSPHVPIRL